MPSKVYKQSEQPAPAGQAPDISQVVAALNQVFAALQSQLQNQAPRPFDGAAEKAVNVFNDIVLGLTLNGTAASAVAEDAAERRKEHSHVYEDRSTGS